MIHMAVTIRIGDATRVAAVLAAKGVGRPFFVVPKKSALLFDPPPPTHEVVHVVGDEKRLREAALVLYAEHICDLADGRPIELTDDAKVIS